RDLRRRVSPHLLSSSQMTVTARILANGRLVEASVAGVLVRAGEEIVWVDIVGRNESELAPVAKHLNLRPLAVEDALGAHQRPKLDDFGSHLFFVFYGLGESPDEDDDEEFDVFI